MSSEFKIKMPIVAAGSGVSVVVDGIDLTDKIREIYIHARVGEVTELVIKFGAAVDIEGEAIVKLLDHEGKLIGGEDED